MISFQPPFSLPARQENSRLRQRFATLLRHEVRKVVAQDDEVDDELRHLLRLLAG